MTAYYNEFDPKAAAWLRELIRQGLIAPGDVDDRSITEVTPDDLKGYTQCHFFAGIGVWSYALRLAGWDDSRPLWTGSCPCQPFSAAGKGAGFDDDRHLWPVWFGLIRESRPNVIFGEQVASKAGLGWFDALQTDLEAQDYACGAVDTCAAGVGAPHIRQRLYLVAERLADADALRWARERGSGAAQGVRAPELLEASGRAHAGPTNGFWTNPDWLGCRDGKFRPVESGTFPLVDGAPARVVRLRGYGNAINAEQARAFIEAYTEIER